MTGDVTPTEYINLIEAAWRIAGIDDYTEADLEWLDTGDRLNDAAKLHEATRELRQRLTDGELVACYKPKPGKWAPVPELVWTDDDACLDRGSPDPMFRDFYFLHPRGVEINGVRTPAFLLETAFEEFVSGGAKKRKLPEPKRPPGRPRGSGAIDDNRWLLEMDRLCEDGVPPKTAANAVVADHKDEIERGKGVSDDHVAQRLCRKWKDTRAAKSE
jgi:hypothetical protein